MSRWERFDSGARRYRTVALTVMLLSASGRADELEPLPSPLRLEDARRLAREHRSEIAAARARTSAASHRPAIVSGLDDPEIAPSVNHLPFSLQGANVSLTFEQRFPLSHVLGHRSEAAQAEARRYGADQQRVELDVELDAANALVALNEKRAVAEVIAGQLALAKQLLASATARYSAGGAAQADVLRAESELARLEASSRALQAELRAAEATVLVSLGRPPGAVVPPIALAVRAEPPPELAAVVQQSLDARPELKAGHAEVDRAEAAGRAARSEDAPMAMVRTGPAYTMVDGPGWMVMVGVTVPIWREKRNAAIAEADAIGESARADLSALQRAVEGDAARSREQVAAARERYLALRDEVVPRAQKAIQPTLAAYVSGQVPLVSVIETAEALWAAQAEQVTAEGELELSWARLDRATGR